jgi:hypothetical protein
MSPKTMRVIGIIFMLGAVFFMVINLKRVADAKTFWIGLPLLLFGLILTIRARKAGAS